LIKPYKPKASEAIRTVSNAVNMRVDIKKTDALGCESVHLEKQFPKSITANCFHYCI
jgi:hypothetical protein